MLLTSYKYKCSKFDPIAVFIYFSPQNCILFTFLVLPSIVSKQDYAKRAFQLTSYNDPNFKFMTFDSSIASVYKKMKNTQKKRREM
jgi:hypothetical protein